MKRYGVYETEKYMATLENPKQPEFVLIEQLNKCQAWVVRDVANGVVCLQSYNTIVSVKQGDEGVSLGHWSVTTSKHQSFFRRWCSRNAGV